MRKYLYQMMMGIFPIYFTALVIVLIIIAVFIGTNNAHAQTNAVSLFENSQKATLNSTAFSTNLIHTTVYTDIIVDEDKEVIEFSFNPAHDHILVTSERKVVNMVVYDRSNNVVEDVIIDIDRQDIDFSSSCPGIYYVRVDYIGGSYLKRMVVQ